jgi:hypothetical protein
MRRCLAVALLLLAAACTTGAGEAPASTTGLPATTLTTGTSAPPVDSTGPPTTSSTIAATTTTTVGLDATVIEYRVIADIDFPVQLTSRPGDSMSYLITKDGRVWGYDGSSLGSEPVLDISDRVRDEGERGLLSIALHPSDPSRLYLHYSDNDGDTTVSEFRLVTPNRADPGSERVLLQVGQPAPNHNGGMIAFTPDGALLLGLGDGGGADDQFGNGQNPDTLLGGLVAIAVDGEPDPAKYAMGLRNPWRFWIDEGLIYVADVGQDEFEEVNVAPLGPGLNYGWPVAEGVHCFNSPAGCDTSGQVIPVAEIRHGDEGTCSITGGIVYRGGALPRLDGHYFFSDYCGGYLRSFLYTDGGATEHRDWTEQVGVAGQATGFGVDGRGEMYLTTTRQLLEVVPAG